MHFGKVAHEEGCEFNAKFELLAAAKINESVVVSAKLVLTLLQNDLATTMQACNNDNEYHSNDYLLVKSLCNSKRIFFLKIF